MDPSPREGSEVLRTKATSRNPSHRTKKKRRIKPPTHISHHPAHWYIHSIPKQQEAQDCISCSRPKGALVLHQPHESTLVSRSRRRKLGFISCHRVSPKTSGCVAPANGSQQALGNLRWQTGNTDCYSKKKKGQMKTKYWKGIWSVRSRNTRREIDCLKDIIVLAWFKDSGSFSFAEKCLVLWYLK